MKIRSRDGRRKLLDGLIILVVLIGTILSAEAHGATYYLSPHGSDAGSGTSSGSPWLTFSFAVPKLLPGDRLILINGTYNGANSGYPSIQCGANANNGTPAQQITVTAQNERQAFLNGTGYQVVLDIKNCAFWTFDGLRVESADAQGGGVAGTAIYVEGSNHMTFRRMLVSHNNRYQNSSLFRLSDTRDSLIEECEFYSYHRYGIITSRGENIIIRRNYINSRNTPDIAGGRASGYSDMGDGGISLYPGSNTIVENNIVENVSLAYAMEAAYGQAIDNKFLGNISLNNNYGAIFSARGNTLEQMPRNTLLENHISLNSRLYGGFFRAAKNTQCNHCMALNSQLGGFAADKPSEAGDGNPTFFSTNTLAANNALYGFLLANQSDWSIDHANAIGQSHNFSPSSGSGLSNTSSMDPGLGPCKVFIPENSPLKGAGKNGADIGANVLYRYQDGMLTSIPLWSETGKFTCGAQVAGVNDIAGSSCFDAHIRLNVNTNGCNFPPGYGTGAPQDEEPPLTPTNLRVVNP